MLKKITALLILTISPISFYAQDWVPVISGFGYNASECHLEFSCKVKNIDDDNVAEANMYKIIIFNVNDNSEIFSADVQTDEIKALSSSMSKSWSIDLPALAGYRPDVTYKIAVEANKNGKFEFDKKNNRVESAQFACGIKALNNSPAAQKGGATGDSDGDPLKAQQEKHDNAMKDLAQDALAAKATREQMAADRAASQNQEKQTLTSKVENLRVKISRRTAERDQQAVDSKEWSDLSYEVADLELEKKIAETELEKVTDEIAYGAEGLDKTEKERYKVKLEKLNSQQSEVRKNQKNGVPFGQTSGENTKESKEESPDRLGNQEKKESSEKQATEEKSEDKKSDKDKDNKEEEDDDKISYLTADEISALSNFDLKKLKFDSNKKIARREVKQTTRSAFLSPAEKAALQTEIDELKKQIVLADAELTKRGEAKEAEETKE